MRNIFAGAFFISLHEFDLLFREENKTGRTFIIDRAIYSEVCLNKFEKDYLITWEKGYKRDGWDEKKENTIIFAMTIIMFEF